MFLAVVLHYSSLTVPFFLCFLAGRNFESDEAGDGRDASV